MPADKVPQGEPLILKQESRPIKKEINYLNLVNVPSDGVTGRFNDFSYVDILDNITEAENSLKYVTGRGNREEINNRLRILHNMKMQHDGHLQVQEENEYNYETFMSFDKEQRRVLRTGYEILTSTQKEEKSPLVSAFREVGINLEYGTLKDKSYMNIPAYAAPLELYAGINDLELKNDVDVLVKAYKEKRALVGEGADTEKFKRADKFIQDYEAAFSGK